MPVLFALIGATGIGKSRLSLDLASHYHAEIVGMDSRQIYKGFAIGTAQPSRADLEKVKHHLVDFLPPEQVYSAGAFCADVKRLLQENPEKNFILVGGTGLYLQSLMLGLPKIPKIKEGLREELEREAHEGGAGRLFEMAREVDPESIEKVDPNNVMRIVRILEVWKSTGKRLSAWQKEREGGVGEIPAFWLDRSRDNLYARIDSRVDQMVRDGWLEEVRCLARSVPLDAPAWQSLGYRELLTANSSSGVAQVIEDVKRKTRNYAKRQLTWFRWQVKSSIVDLDTEKDPMAYITGKFEQTIF